MANNNKTTMDTDFGLEFDNFSELVESRGFNRVYEEEFFDRIPCDLHLWVNYDKGYLLVAKSYFEQLNSAVLYSQCTFDEWELPKIDGLFRKIN